MLTIDPKTEKTALVHKYILGAVAPRPIAFASTIDKTGNLNLSPFSFFNAFSANPPILIFSPARRVRGNTIKHTLENIMATNEVVIGIVTSEMAEQVSLSSCDFEQGVNEFKKAGFTAEKADLIKPSLIKQSPVNFECKVNKVIELGEEGGAGNLVICEVLKIHIVKAILDANENIDPFKLNALSRLGGNWYGKATKDSLFELEKPIGKTGMGFDNLPNDIRASSILSGSDLAILASWEEIPSKTSFLEREWKNIEEKHTLAKKYLRQGNVNEAWQILL
jgi:flavin reductase (DIM6/NTAB) family NADH-FMN oxidoreductase RutF|tara:strand:+ start:3128 stop:3964 length:837 start_codon:yes stop_codon:yes gene_type:complete